MKTLVVRRIHEVFGAGLELKERLERGESPRFDTEYNRLLNLLIAGGELEYDPVYRGDLYSTRSGGSMSLGGMYLGVQYALASWLDEVFMLDAPEYWANQWRENSVEVRLFGGSQDRGWRFWEQARRAEGPKGSPEALEAYLWAVMLGFRGNPDSINPPINPPQWVDNVRRRVLSARAAEFPAPAQREAPTRVPPLKGSDRLVRMLRLAVVVVAAAAFAVSLAVTRWMAADDTKGPPPKPRGAAAAPPRA